MMRYTTTAFLLHFLAGMLVIECQGKKPDVVLTLPKDCEQPCNNRCVKAMEELCGKDDPKCLAIGEEACGKSVLGCKGLVCKDCSTGNFYCNYCKPCIKCKPCKPCVLSCNN